MAGSGEEGRVVVDLRSAAESAAAADEEAHAVVPLHEIESLFMRCGENGTTRLLLTRIPHVREVVLMTFECPHCAEMQCDVHLHFAETCAMNNEIQFAGQLRPKGCCYRLEVPSGQSEVEGIIMRAVDELQALQDERKKVDPENAEAIDQFLVKLRSLGSGESTFTFVLDDPAGNSFIENPHAPSLDPLLSVRFY